MKKKNIEAKISRAMQEMVPEGAYQKISEKIIPAQREERTRIEMKANNKILRFAVPAIAACLGIVIGIFGFSIYSSNFAVASIIDIDVNPAIEIEVNSKDRVLAVNPLNEEGVEVIDGMDLEKTDLKVAVNALAGSMVSKGYIIDNESGLLVTVQNESEIKARHIRDTVMESIDKSLKERNVSASVINQTLTEKDSAKDMAHELGISIGKAVFIKNIAAKDSSLKEEELAKMKISEIARLVVEKKIDISDIADYDEEDSIWENISESIEEVNEDAAESKPEKVESKPEKVESKPESKPEKVENKPQVEQKPEPKPQENASSKVTSSKEPASSEPSEISLAKAKSIALNHAGVSSSKATFTKAVKERDDGFIKYEIDFYAGDYEYDYEISAKSGKVLEADKERRDYEDIREEKPEPAPEAPSIISAKKAKSIALSHAGLSSSEVTFIKAEKDRDDGRTVYEIEFYDGRIEYSYEINAETGKIIDFEKEIEDDD